MLFKDDSVGARLGNQQDHSIEPGIPFLEERLPLDGLEIGKTRLGLDPDRLAAHARPGIDRAKIAGDREWHLGRPRRTDGQSRPESVEEPQLRLVADRLASKIRTRPEVEPDRRARQGDLAHGDVCQLVTFDPAERRWIETDGRGGFPNADPAATARDADLCTDLRRRVVGARQRSVARPFPTPHVPSSLAHGDWPRLICPAGYDAAVRLIDSHCHLNAERFAGDVAAVLERARSIGVERILLPGWNPASCERALALAEEHPWLDASVGVHPHDAAKVDDAGWSRIVALAANPRVVAVGETGLDYDRVFSPIPDQLTNLRRNLALALETGKPAILHVRSSAGRSDAQDAILAELRAAGYGGQASASAFGTARPPALIHSFSGSVEYAREVLGLGLAISISGLAFRAGEEATADVVPLVPVDRLLVETDSPFLSPPGGNRGRNEPEWVRITTSWVAARRAAEATAFGDALVAAYDRTFGVAVAR